MDLMQATRHAARVRLMIFDVDGVLTDGQLYYGAQGDTLKGFSTLDGFGLRLLAYAGIATALITGRQSEIVTARARELGIDHVFQGAREKGPVFDALLAQTGLDASVAGYMGDDWPDLPVLARAGFAAAPANAHAEVRSRVHWVTRSPGGHGAVREICDLLLQAQGHYDAMLARASGG